MSPDGLMLRDIHAPLAPPWWPPAPGWWAVFAVIAVAITIAAWWFARRRTYRHSVMAMFDQGITTSSTPAAQVAAMSELLRRAARRREPHADTLQGDAWLLFLDGGATPARFSQGAGRLLLEGGFQREVDHAHVDALVPIARARYLELMAARP
ncbi:MAG: DUF4381 family protein [Luteimonas sp.]